MNCMGSGLVVDLIPGVFIGLAGSGLRADIMPRPISGLRLGLVGSWLLATISGVGLRIDRLGSGLNACLTGIGGTGFWISWAGSSPFLGALTVDVVDADLDIEVLMYFSDLATRAAGSGAVGRGFIGERGGVVAF